MTLDGVAGTRFGVWAPNAERVSVVGDFNRWDGRTHMLQSRGASGVWELFVPGVGARRPVQVRDPQPQHRRGDREGRSVRARRRAAPRHREPRRGGSGLRLARRRLARAPRALGLAARADVHLRGARGLVAAPSGRPALHLPRAGRAPRAVRRRDGVHARRADADLRAPARRVVGLPDDRLLRADAAARRAGRAARLHRRLPRRRHRRDPRLGARPLPARRLGARALRRHRALRARGSAPGGASGLGHRDLQLRPQRGEGLSALLGALLARGVPLRRAAGGRGGVDALPRLLAQARRVAAQQVRRPREPRGGRFPARAERDGARRFPRRADDRRGIDGVADGIAPGLPRRARLLAQVEHGLDARHARVRPARPGAPPLSPRPADVRPALRLHRELRAALLARRGGARQGRAASRRCRATTGSATPTRGCWRPTR